MDLFWILFNVNQQLFYQFLNIPFALLLYYLARHGHLSILSRCSIPKKCQFLPYILCEIKSYNVHLFPKGMSI